MHDLVPKWLCDLFIQQGEGMLADRAWQHTLVQPIETLHLEHLNFSKLKCSSAFHLHNKYMEFYEDIQKISQVKNAMLHAAHLSEQPMSLRIDHRKQQCR